MNNLKRATVLATTNTNMYRYYSRFDDLMVKRRTVPLLTSHLTDAADGKMPNTTQMNFHHRYITIKSRLIDANSTAYHDENASVTTSYGTNLPSSLC